MKKYFTLLLLAIFVAGCSSHLKTKSEWYKSLLCNVKLEHSDGAILCTRVEPIFPKKAAIKNLSGSVTISFNVDPQGKTKNLNIEHSSPKRVFEKAAKEAVRQWRFIPKFENDMPTEDVALKFKLTFSLGDEVNITR